MYISGCCEIAVSLIHSTCSSEPHIHTKHKHFCLTLSFIHRSSLGCCNDVSAKKRQHGLSDRPKSDHIPCHSRCWRHGLLWLRHHAVLWWRCRGPVTLEQSHSRAGLVHARSTREELEQTTKIGRPTAFPFSVAKPSTRTIKSQWQQYYYVWLRRKHLAKPQYETSCPGRSMLRERYSMLDSKYTPRPIRHQDHPPYIPHSRRSYGSIKLWNLLRLLLPYMSKLESAA